MEWVVTTGKTVEEAKDAALDELGVDEADAEFEILEEPRQGLFGRQRGEARVRARVRPTAPRPKLDRRRRRGRDGDEGEASTALSAGAVVTAEEPLMSDAPPGSGSDGGGRRSRRPRQSRPRPSVEPGLDSALRTAKREETTVADEERSLPQQAEMARQFLEGLLAQFMLPAEVSTVNIDDETVEVRVTGPELGLLVGPKGQTLAAIQELTRTVVQGHSAGRSGRLFVDVAGYRQRRKEALERFTRHVAEDVIASGVQKVLEPMTAADRKVVHDTANEIGGVRTMSEGEDPVRRVVVIPDSSSA